jgi:hypothetical protein
MRRLLGFGLLAVVSVPIGIVLTFLLIPFWRWLEQTTGIESIGHSGPAEWCYVAMVLLSLAGLGAAAGVKSLVKARMAELRRRGK